MDGAKVIHRFGFGGYELSEVHLTLSRMTAEPNTFHDRDDVGNVLSEIIRIGRPTRGTTLVALVDLATGTVCDIHHLETPEPLPADACDVSGELSLLMSPTLCELAQKCVPERPWLQGFGWSTPGWELVTVVCRESEPAASEYETQYFWGWRYSNHLTMARVFPKRVWLSDAASADLLVRLAPVGVVGDAVYDALVGEAARVNGRHLLTRDQRARRTYDLLGVQHRFVG